MARGHIRPHGTGKWRLQVYVGRDPVTGRDKQVSRVVTGTRSQAETALAEMVTQVAGGDGAGTAARTLGQVIDAYVASREFDLEATTWTTYRHYAKYVTDHLRKTPVNRVGVEALEALYVHLRRQGRRRDGGPMSGSAVKSVHLVVRGALEYARRRKWVARNVAEDARVPTGRAHKPSPAPAESVAQLLRAAALEHEALPTYLRVSICAGGRRSEVHGLRWSGVDFERGRLLLRDVVVRADARWIVKPRTKTGSSRVVALDAGTVDALRALHAHALELALDCGTTLRREAFVFSDDPTGSTHWNPRTTAARFTRVCRRVGVDPATRLHDLRHLMATHAIDEGVPLPAVSARLGHASNAITLDLYAGRVPRSDEIAAEVMGRLLDGE